MKEGLSFYRQIPALVLLAGLILSSCGRGFQVTDFALSTVTPLPTLSTPGQMSSESFQLVNPCALPEMPLDELNLFDITLERFFTSTIEIDDLWTYLILPNYLDVNREMLAKVYKYAFSIKQSDILWVNGDYKKLNFSPLINGSTILITEDTVPIIENCTFNGAAYTNNSSEGSGYPDFSVVDLKRILVDENGRVDLDDLLRAISTEIGQTTTYSGMEINTNESVFNGFGVVISTAQEANRLGLQNPEDIMNLYYYNLSLIPPLTMYSTGETVLPAIFTEEYVLKVVAEINQQVFEYKK